MINNIAHVGITVKNMEKSIAFYRDVLGLKFLGEAVMQGEATDRLFASHDVVARVAYLNGSDHIMTPPVELICFEGGAMESKATLTRCGISEICFLTDDIEGEYARLKTLGVEFLSSPEEFDFTSYGFNRSKAVYFRDVDGIILELVENLI